MTAIAEGLTLEETAVAELSAGLRGEIVGRDDPVYDEARKIWNGSIDRRPALIARCAGVADVIAAGPTVDISISVCGAIAAVTSRSA